MSENKPVAKKTVRIKENELVDLIDNIVNEAVAVKKQEWLNEQANKEKEKNSLLESKVAKLESIVNKLTESKK
jgi:hypothetical protein